MTTQTTGQVGIGALDEPPRFSIYSILRVKASREPDCYV